MHTNNIVASSLLLGLPILYFIFVKEYQIVKEDQIVDAYIESILSGLLLCNMFLSILFWSYPIVNTTLYFIDIRMAKLSVVIFSLYTVFYKTCSLWYKGSFLLCLFGSSIFFFKSRNYGLREWCCNEHIFNHLFFHIFISLGCFFTFF
jgi:hypothetical protein